MCKFIFSVVRASCSLTGTRERDAPTTNFIFACIGMLPIPIACCLLPIALSQLLFSMPTYLISKQNKYLIFALTHH